MKEAAHQLNYNDDAVLHLIKATMPSEIYGTLYNQDDLNVVITMVKDICAKKPEPTNPPTPTRGAAAPTEPQMELARESTFKVMSSHWIESTG